MKLFGKILLFGLFVSFLGGQAFAIGPDETFKNALDKVMVVLERSEDGCTPEQIQEIWEIIAPLIDKETMARNSLGKYWAQRSESEQKEFTEVLIDVIRYFYLGKLKEYKGGSVTIESVKFNKGKDKALVETKAVNGETEHNISYLMRIESGGWLIYDIIIEGVSITKSYRAQSYEVCKAKGFDELMKQLKIKREKLLEKVEGIAK